MKKLFNSIVIACINELQHKNGSFIPRLYFDASKIKGPGAIGTVEMSWDNDNEKYEMLRKVGTMLGEKEIYQMILVADVYVRKIKDEKQAAYYMQNQDTEKLSLYPESMRQSALVYHLIDFKSLKEEMFSLNSYSVVEGKFEFDPPNVMDCSSGDMALGDMKKELVAGFMTGYLKARLFNDFLMKGHDNPDIEKGMTTAEEMLEKYPGLKEFAEEEEKKVERLKGK